VDVKNKSELSTLVKRARVCISVVSYDHVGAEVIEACIESQTDYIDTYVS
jgi:saccharopine dehydrogenase-like NADP-dependent oxidoreductase